MDGTGSSGIDESVTQSVVGAELREPTATPYPMRKKRIGPAGQERR